MERGPLAIVFRFGVVGQSLHIGHQGRAKSSVVCKKHFDGFALRSDDLIARCQLSPGICGIKSERGNAIEQVGQHLMKMTGGLHLV